LNQISQHSLPNWNNSRLEISPEAPNRTVHTLSPNSRSDEIHRLAILFVCICLMWLMRYARRNKEACLCRSSKTDLMFNINNIPPLCA
jgi:hypothetical protein